MELAHSLCICAYVGFFLFLFFTTAVCDFEVLFRCVNVAFAEKCMGCGGFNVSVYVCQLSVMYLSVSALVSLPHVFFPFSLFLSSALLLSV